MTCACGGTRKARLIENVAITMCNRCGKGEFIPQSSMAEVSDYRREVNRLMDLEREREILPPDFFRLSAIIQEI